MTLRVLALLLVVTFSAPAASDFYSGDVATVGRAGRTQDSVAFTIHDGHIVTGVIYSLYYGAKLSFHGHVTAGGRLKATITGGKDTKGSFRGKVTADRITAHGTARNSQLGAARLGITAELSLQKGIDDISGRFEGAVPASGGGRYQISGIFSGDKTAPTVGIGMSVLSPDQQYLTISTAMLRPADWAKSNFSPPLISFKTNTGRSGILDLNFILRDRSSTGSADIYTYELRVTLHIDGFPGMPFVSKGLFVTVMK